MAGSAVGQGEGVGRAVLSSACPWGLWWPQNVQVLIKTLTAAKCGRQELKQVINVAVLVLGDGAFAELL